MGINGLFSFLKKYSEKQRVADAVKGKKIAVDIFWFIHKSKGDIEKIKDMLDDYVQGCSCVLFIFDGKVSDERKPELSALKVKRQEMQSLIENLEKEVIHLGENADSKKKELMKYIEELRLQSWAPKGNYVDTVKELIEKWWGLERCSVIVAPYEADLYFGELESSGKIDYIVSNDSDMLALGYNKVMKPGEGDEKDCVRIYRRDKILNELKMSDGDWFEFIKLCRRYASTCPSKYDILVPYSYWRVYKRGEQNL